MRIATAICCNRGASAYLRGAVAYDLRRIGPGLSISVGLQGGRSGNFVENPD